MPRNLDLALIGNGAIGLLVDSTGAVVWGCFPRFDGDATFCALLDDAAPGEERGIYAVEIVDFARAEQSYCTNTAVLVTRLFDQTGGEVEITDCVPRFMQHGRVFHPMAHVRTVRRVAGSPRVRIRLRPAAGYGRAHPGDHRRQQPHPLRHAGRDAAAHDRRVADRRPRGTAVLPGQHRHAAPRARRNRPERRRRDRPPVRRGDDQVLARLGAPARDTVRMAGRRHPRGDHAPAERVRRHRGDRRGDDDVDSRGDRIVPQLGLPVLLAPRRLLRRRRAEPAGRHRNHGGISRVHRRHRRRQRRVAAARLSHQRRFRARRGDREVAARLSRHGPRANRQRCLPAGAARRLRLRRSRVHARLLRRAPRQARRRGAVRAARGPRPPGDRGVRPAGRRPLGAARQPARAHVLERDVLGGLRPPVPHRGAARDGRARAAMARERRAHPALRRGAVLERRAEVLRRHRRRRLRSTRACSCSATWASCGLPIRDSARRSMRSKAS